MREKTIAQSIGVVRGAVMSILTDEEKQQRKALRDERALVAAIRNQQRAETRVKRATTILKRWSDERRRIEKRIGADAVRAITVRLTHNVNNVNAATEE